MHCLNSTRIHALQPPLTLKQLGAGRQRSLANGRRQRASRRRLLGRPRQRLQLISGIRWAPCCNRQTVGKSDECQCSSSSNTSAQQLATETQRKWTWRRGQQRHRQQHSRPAPNLASCLESPPDRQEWRLLLETAPNQSRPAPCLVPGSWVAAAEGQQLAGRASASQRNALQIIHRLSTQCLPVDRRPGGAARKHKMRLQGGNSLATLSD